MGFVFVCLFYIIVFDILLIYRDTGSWSEALGAGFPTGKGYVVFSEAQADLS